MITSFVSGARHAIRTTMLLLQWAVGVPETGSVQEVLQWQTCTVRMMYGIVHDALREVGSQDHPLEYLSFFCLGKPLASNFSHPLCFRHAPGCNLPPPL